MPEGEESNLDEPAMPDVPWDIRREGRRWRAEEARERFALTPEKFAMVDGKLFWSDRDRRGVAHPGKEPERIGDPEQQGTHPGLQLIVEGDLLRSAQQVDREPRQHHQQKGKKVERVAPGEPAGPVGRGDGIEVDQRAEEEGEGVRDPEEVGIAPDVPGGVIHHRGQVDREAEHQPGQQPVGGTVPPPGGQRPGQADALDGAEQGDEVEPVESHTRHGEDHTDTRYGRR